MQLTVKQENHFLISLQVVVLIHYAG